MKHTTLVAALAIVLGAAGVATAAPAGYPASYAGLVDAARAEGTLVVYSVLSNKAAAPLVQDFMLAYPGIKVDYDGEKGSNEMDAWFRDGEATGNGADVVWSSSMDLQMALVKEGHAQPYHSAEAAKLPSWASYRDLAYGTTFEPVAIVYNQQLVPRELVPRDHAEFERFIRDPRFKGKVAAFDIEKSGVGFMFAAQDMQHYKAMPALLRSLGAAGYQRSPGTGHMLTKINAGEYLIGYNVMGSYAMSRAATDLPQLGVVMPSDYTMVLTRISLIAAHARHPNAARVWTDYLLSARGQKVLGDVVKLAPVRDDVDALVSQTSWAGALAGHARPIAVNLELTEPLQPQRHAALVRTWNDTVSTGAH
jgi:iron(III) transport system substrate-binding protein